MTALELFRANMDTMEIADRLGIHECEVEQIIHRQRSKEKGVEAVSKRMAS